MHLDKETLKILGLVDLGKYTPERLKDVPADHALVCMFQSFQGQYIQTISAHLSKGAVKGEELAKIMMEAIVLLEQSDFFVDALVGDAAPWNRNMWRKFGLKKKSYEREASQRKYTVDDNDDDDDDDDEVDENLDKDLLAYTMPKRTAAKKTKKKTARRKKRTILTTADDESIDSGASCIHPVDDKRRLWFVSDFPHLIKSVKQRVLNAEELEVTIACNKQQKIQVKNSDLT